MNGILEDWKKIKQVTRLPWKKRKEKKIWKTVYQSDYLPFLEKYWYILPNKKTASLSKRDDD